jgi:hypothetical protein
MDASLTKNEDGCGVARMAVIGVGVLSLGRSLNTNRMDLSFREGNPRFGLFVAP